MFIIFETATWNLGLGSSGRKVDTPKEIHPSSSGRKVDTPKEIHPIKTLNKQQFSRTFHVSKDGQILPSVAKFNPTSTENYPGCVLRVRMTEDSVVQETLKKNNESEEICGYTEVHLPTIIIAAVQDCVEDHQLQSSECKGQLITANEPC